MVDVAHHVGASENGRGMTRPLFSWALVAALVAPTLAHAQSSGWTAKKATRPAAMIEALGSKPRIRVLVELAEPQARRGEIGSAAHRASVAALQSSVLAASIRSASIGKEGAPGDAGDLHKLRKLVSVPAFALDVTRLELERLASDPRVRSLTLDESLQPHVGQSTALIGMNQASLSPYFATGAGRAVAILDTGVSLQHEFLSPTRIIAQACFSGGGSSFSSLCPNGRVSQIGPGAGRNCSLALSGLCAHGTHVGGIAAGFNTGLGGSEPLRGAAPTSKIVAVQVFSTSLSAYYSDLAAALDWIYANRGGFTTPIAAINISIGGLTYASACDTVYPTMTRLIEQLRSAGIATVISAGNNAAVDRVAFPACISAAVAVGATTKSTSTQPERIASYSNMGGMVDVLAPGGDSDYPAVGDPGLLSSVPGSNSYQTKKGTSMAAPHVAGAIAAIASTPSCGRKTADQIEAALKQTGRRISDRRAGGRFARRRIWVPDALNLLGCKSGSAARVASAG